MAALGALTTVAAVAPAAATHSGYAHDPGFSCQWSLHHTGQAPGSCEDGGARGSDIGALEAWQEAATRGVARPAVIAIAEVHGFDLAHEDLREQLWVNSGEDGVDEHGRSKRSNGVDDDCNGYIDDVHGWNFRTDSHDFSPGSHGTAVASIAAADGDNGIGMTGVAGLDGQAKIMVLGRPFHGDPLNAYARMFDYARTMGADVINNSYGAPGPTGDGPEARAWLSLGNIEASRALDEAGVVQVFAGNTDDGSPYVMDGWDAYDFPGVLRVMASGRDGGRLRHAAPPLVSEWEIAAPGTDVYVAKPGNRYVFDGNPEVGETSYATPHVTGAAALIKAVYPELHGHEVARAIIESADRHPSYEGVNEAGGTVDAHRALVRAGQILAEGGRTVQPVARPRCGSAA